MTPFPFSPVRRLGWPRISYRSSNSVQFTVSSRSNHLSAYLTDYPVYYRLYTLAGAVPSRNRVFSNSQYIGRIDAACVAPPHTAESIKRCVASHEDIIDYRCLALFEALSSKTPIRNEDYVPILVGTGPGSTPQEPMALVVVDASDLVNANNSIPDRTYIIKNPDRDCVWDARNNPIQNVYFESRRMDVLRSATWGQVSLSSPYHRLSHACSTI
jgi:hypothetical protein